ncbi:MAG: tocopherol cyclase family protein [Saprospiraceae bacterium]
MILPKIKAFFNPEQFQGWGKHRNYFEGWYYKIINASETAAFAFIPGIAMDEAGNQQAFIQILDGKNENANYYRFDAKDFKATPYQFQIEIGNNYFSEQSIELNLPDIKAALKFSGNVPWPKPWYSPGIMGPFAFVPFMECYHGIVSMDHSITGHVLVNNKHIDFNNGRGYIEKDWGRSFPSAYVWMQSNHFTLPGVSFKASVAKIPWIRSSFVGFIAGFWLQNKLIKFTTYNQSHLRTCHIDNHKVEIILENNKYRLHVNASRNNATALASPIRGLMDGRIEESMTSILEVKLVDLKSNQQIFHDFGRNAGLEVAGNIKEITS